jgi:predicted RNase H-like HicB family nuclease
MARGGVPVWGVESLGGLNPGAVGIASTLHRWHRGVEGTVRRDRSPSGSFGVRWPTEVRSDPLNQAPEGVHNPWVRVLTQVDLGEQATNRGKKGPPPMTFTIELEQESDGRWLGEISALPGVLAYGVTATDAIARVQALALRVLADRLEHGEAVPEFLTVSFRAA